MRLRLPVIVLVLAAAALPAAAQTNSGGGTRALGGAVAGEIGKLPGGRPIQPPTDTGAGTSESPFLKDFNPYASVVGEGTSKDLEKVAAAKQAQPQQPAKPKPPISCPAGKFPYFSDLLNDWTCL